MRHARSSLMSLAGLFGLSLALLPAAPSAALQVRGQPAHAPATAGRAPGLSAERPPRLPDGAVRVGALSSRAVLHLDVTLRVRNPSALAAFISALSDRASPQFHHFLRPGQFAARFGPTPGQVAAVESALRGQGLTPGPAAPDRLSIPVTASAATVERALRTGLASYRLATGRVELLG